MESLKRMLKVYIRFSKVAKRRKTVKFVLLVNALIFLCVILSGLVIVTVRSVYQTSSTISSVGTFKAIGIGVYWDHDCTRSVNALDWGSLEPGSKKSFTVYICNDGSVPLTLSMATSNWNPTTASNYMTLTWNYNGQTISAGKTVQVTLTLTVNINIAGINNFNFDITAVGTYAKQSR